MYLAWIALTLRLEYVVQTVPIPTIRPTELLLKVKAAGFCHTDTAVPRMVFGQALPFTGSHEPAGEVVALGAEATRHGNFQIGSRVAAVNTARWCGECPECKYHDPRYCAKQHMIGLVGTDGAFADYCIVDASRAALLPESMSYEQVHPPTPCAVDLADHSGRSYELRRGHRVLGHQACESATWRRNFDLQLILEPLMFR